MKALHMIAWILLIVGGLNWGLEFFGVAVGNYIPSGLASLIYILVGLSALFELFTHKSYCKHCETKPAGGMNPM
jgi:uncharacterized membrane protein YuzA (DUF378 family)